jgi:hypothetical protein
MVFRELKRIKRSVQTPWVLLEDFNLIYRAQDKNTDHLNRRLMVRFRRVLNFLGVKELELIGRHFTWSNNQSTHLD